MVIVANIAPFELTEAFTMENFNKRIQTANTEINNLDTNKQDKDTAITTANIGSQSVNYANDAGNADTVDGKHASAFGSYGWSGEGVPHITERLKQLRRKVTDGFTVKFKPSLDELEKAKIFGKEFAEKILGA